MKHLKHIAVHCPTKELAVKVLKKANSEGGKWRSDDSFLNKIVWDTYKKKTCYSLSEGGYGYVYFYEKEGFKIISAQEYLDMDINLDSYEPKKELIGVPKPIIKRMLECQKEQGNDVDVSVFEKKLVLDKERGGFNWEDTKENYNFWCDVLRNKKYNLFFNKLSEEVTFPQKMWTWDTDKRLACIREVLHYAENLTHPYLVLSNKLSLGMYIGYKNASLTNPNIKTQKEIFKDIQKAGFNITTCGNCGSTVLMNKEMMEGETVRCESCCKEIKQCDLPDLYQ